MNMPVSRNNKNVLSKQRLTSANLSNFMSGSFISSVNRQEVYNERVQKKINNYQKFFPTERVNIKSSNNENKNNANINKIKKTKIFGSNKFNPKSIKSKPGSIILKSKPEFRFVEFKKQYSNIPINNFIENKDIMCELKNRPKLSRCQSFVQKPNLKSTKIINSSKNSLFYQYLSKDIQMY